MGLYFPMFVDLSDKNILFVGAGSVNAGRIATMLDFAGKVTVISPEIDESIIPIARERRFDFHPRRFEEGDLDGADVVFAATGSADTDISISEMCKCRNIPVNAESAPTMCDFFFPGIARRDPIVIGVTASGEDPALAAKATDYLKDLFEE